MGARGPKSTLSAVVFSGSEVASIAQRLDIPEELTASERLLWNKLIDGEVAGYFGVSDVPVLKAYVQSVAMVERATAEAKEAPFITPEGFRNPIFDVLDKLQARMVQLATKLRLTQQAKLSAGKAATQAKHRGSQALYG